MTNSLRSINAEKSPFSNMLSQGCMLQPADPKVEFGWIASLPIAGAIFRIEKDEVRHVLSNRKFDDLAGLTANPVSTWRHSPSECLAWSMLGATRISNVGNRPTP
jgi:hypothetical protein